MIFSSSKRTYMKKIIQYTTPSIRPPITLLLTIMFITSGAIAQENTLLSPKFNSIAKPESTKGWIYFREDYKANPLTIFDDLKDAFELSKDDQMLLQKTEKDELGFTTYHYQQYYKKYPVLYGEYLVHQQADSFVNVANGRLITGIKANNNVTVAEKQALEAALRFMNARKYLWQNIDMEKELKRQEKNENATYFPRGELVYAPGKNDGTFNASDYILTWHFKIYTNDAKVTPKSVYVDALTGKIVHYVDIAMYCSGGTGTSAYNGSVSFSTELSGGSYRSHNNCQSTDIYVYNCNRSTASKTYYTDADNTWTDQSAIQAQWGALMVYNYYLGVHSRTSWDNKASDMIVYNNALYGDPPTANNACWNCSGSPNSIILGAGNTSSPTDDWNTDDIMGHEFTHGVTQASAGLIYSNESGALNESFSDIFGEMVESWAEGNCDYLHGADRGANRSLIDPKTYGQPDTYQGINWYTGTDDAGGVHINSGVQNHWFYLLSEGGSGTNDFGKSYSVTGITRFKARLIAYRALIKYLSSSSQYIDARKASLQAAIDLYGSCSVEVMAVGDAWHAVGVESASPQFTKNVCGTYPASGTLLQAISVLTASANWCSTEITSSSSTVYFTARDHVILYPGFRADKGSNFVAYLEPCNSTLFRAAAPEIVMSDAEKVIKGPITLKTNTSKESASVINNTAESITVAPNPFNSEFIVSINSKQNTKAQVIIYNAVGAKVKEQTGINLSKGLNKISFNGANLSQGIYMIEIQFNNLKVVKKIVKM
jgi:bacillolysin